MYIISVSQFGSDENAYLGQVQVRGMHYVL